RKRFSIAVHYRNVRENEASKVEQGVNEVAGRHRELRRIDGKKVYELLPNVDWDKGKAMLWLLQTLGLEGENVRPIYIGDDTTDEGAFRVLEPDQCGVGIGGVGIGGVGIIVTDHPRQSAARYVLMNSSEVELFLRSLIAGM